MTSELEQFKSQLHSRKVTTASTDQQITEWMQRGRQLLGTDEITAIVQHAEHIDGDVKAATAVLAISSKRFSVGDRIPVAKMCSGELLITTWTVVAVCRGNGDSSPPEGSDAETVIIGWRRHLVG